jgi:hypothetical protein
MTFFSLSGLGRSTKQEAKRFESSSLAPSSFPSINQSINQSINHNTHTHARACLPPKHPRLVKEWVVGRGWRRLQGVQSAGDRSIRSIERVCVCTSHTYMAARRWCEDPLLTIPSTHKIKQQIHPSHRREMALRAAKGEWGDFQESRRGWGWGRWMMLVAAHACSMHPPPPPRWHRTGAKSFKRPCHACH